MLLTPICRRRFTGERGTQTHGHYPDATRAVAYETSTPLIDLTLETAELLERFGPDTSKQLFAPDDNTHLSPEGAHVIARLVVEGLLALGFDLKPQALHERTPFVFGSREEVERIARYKSDLHAIGERSPLFNQRGLFAP